MSRSSSNSIPTISRHFAVVQSNVKVCRLLHQHLKQTTLKMENENCFNGAKARQRSEMKNNGWVSEIEKNTREGKGKVGERTHDIMTSVGARPKAATLNTGCTLPAQHERFCPLWTPISEGRYYLTASVPCLAL